MLLFDTLVGLSALYLPFIIIIIIFTFKIGV